MRLVARLGAVALSGVLYAVAFPPLSWKPLAWLALVPFFLALRRLGAGAALGLAWFWTIVASSLVAGALPGAVETYFLQPRLMSLLFAVFVWTVTGAPYYMMFALAYRALVRRSSVATPFLVAAAWTACELARGRLLNATELFTANPWALLAYSQVGWDAIIQVASLGGVYGVTFCVAAVNAALAEIAHGLWSERRLSHAVALGAAIALLPAAAALIYGYQVLRTAPLIDTQGEIPIALVQPNLAVGSQWRSDTYGAHLETSLRLTLQAEEEGSPKVAFWPESSLTFFLEAEPLYQRALAGVLAHGDLELVLGGPRVEDPDDPDPVYYNSVFVLDPNGRIRGRYDKRHLVPFAEYLPLRRFDFLRRRFERVRAFHHGTAQDPLPTRAGAAGILVCNEAMYPEVAGERARAGATLLVSPSNDTWIQSAVWADRTLDLVSLRAVEQRRWLVRVSTSGPSAIVDPWGRVRQRTAHFEQAVLLGAVTPRAALSLYGRVGDAFGLGCVVAVAIACLGFHGGRATLRRSS